jgi:hypothetical protein
MAYSSAEVRPRDSREGRPGPGITSWTSAARAFTGPAETACREATARRRADAYLVMVMIWDDLEELEKLSVELEDGVELVDVESRRVSRRV